MTRPHVTGCPQLPLAMVDLELPVRVVAVRAGRGLTRRLTELGLNVGSEIRVVGRQGAGLLVARGGSRLAVGGGMAHRILVAPVGKETR